MMSRLLGVLAATLALAAAPLHAAPPSASAEAAAASVTYHIERHNQQVTVKDANEKMLTTFSASTPNIQGVLIRSTSDAGNTSVNKSALPKLTLTLEDQNDRRLWSAPIPVMFPLQIGVNYNSDAGGTQIVITHQTEDTSDPNQPPMSRLTFEIGPDGRPMSFGDASHQYKYVYEPHGFSVVDQDGKILLHGDSEAGNTAIHGPDGSGYSLHFNQDGTETMQINGQTIPIDKATKDGKTYQSFPWNGHKILIENSCSWSVTSDGDLTVNAPSAAKTAASK